MELYRRYRPTLLKHIIGQPETVKVLKEMIENNRVPHAIMLSGPTGVGKTTIARILQTKLKCDDTDFFEINCATNGGVDKIREVQTRTGCAALKTGGSRIWYFDEAHKLSGGSQEGSLKMLEDVPPHVYFILATSDPDKIIKTVRGRCTELKLRKLTETELAQVVNSVLEKESKQISMPVLSVLTEAADGSARKALVLLDQIIGLDTDDEKIEAIRSQDARRQSYELIKLLAFKSGSWAEVSDLINSIEEEPETIRRQMLGLAAKVILDKSSKVNKDKLMNIIDCFECNFFDSGKAGLVRACWNCVKENRK